MSSPIARLLRQIISVALPVLATALLTNSAEAQLQFQQPQVVKYSALGDPWPTGFVTGSFQKPGTTDIMAIYPPTSVNGSLGPSVVAEILNSGSGAFSFPAPNSIGFNGVTSLVATTGDFNGDGFVDVAFAASHPVAGYEDLCIVYLQSGGSFLDTACVVLPLVQTVTPSLAYIAPISFKTGGLPQLLIEDSANNYLYVVQNNGSLGGLSVLMRYPIPAADGTGPILTGDFNGDGNMDFIVNGQLGHSASVYFGNGDGTFQTPIRYTFGTGVNSMLLHDMDGDGIPDLVTENSTGTIELHHGYTNGSFDTLSTGGSYGLYPVLGGGGHLVGIADLNHDGILDIVTATPAGISVLLGAGNTLRYSLGGIYNAGPGHAAYALQDFNGDGNLDLAVDSPEGIAILYGNPDGSFQTSRSYAAGAPAMSGALGIFTSSGSMDAVVSIGATQAQFLKGNGNGTFTYAGAPGAAAPTTTQTGPAGLTGTVQVGDFNGDGKLDLLITGDGPNAALPVTGAAVAGVVEQLGSGNGNFAAPLTISNFPPLVPCSKAPEQLYGSTVVADLNGDGISDYANRDSTDERIFVGASGAPQPQFSVNFPDANCNLHAHDQIAAGDLDGDGTVDLVEQTDGHLIVQLNPKSVGLAPIGDLSVNGSLTTPGQLTAPALSSTFNGPAIPTSSGGLGFPGFIGSVAIADLDRDGHNDLIVTYANLSANRAAPTSAAPNYIYIWFGSGSGKFLTSGSHPVNPVVITPSRNFYQVAVADLNGDGIPDLILSDGYIVSVQLGDGFGGFGAEQHYLAGQGLNTISVADVDHNGTLDLVVANGGTAWGNPVANLDQAPAAQDVNTGGITVLLNHAAAQLPTITATVAANPEPSTYSNVFNLIATITPSTTNNNPVTGSFTFTVGGVSVGSATISGTTATLAVPASTYATLAPGVYPLTATYSGNGFWAPSTTTGSHTVSLLPSTTDLILCVDPPGSNFPCANPISNTPLISPITMFYGQSLDGVAIESSINLTGTITFLTNANPFCTLNANLQQGSQTCPPYSGIFQAGTTNVIATYSGDSLNAPSTSNSIVVTVFPDITTTAVTTSLNPSPYSQAVTFTAGVQGNFATGAGQVIFLDGATTLGTATLDATGHATLTTSALTPGTHPIRVAFPGSQNFNSSTSATLNQVILASTTPIASNVVLASSLNPSNLGQSVTFTATISTMAAFPVAPTGTVTFYDGAINLGNSVVNPATGMATLTISTLAIGSHPITAVYSGAASSTLPNGTIVPSIQSSTSAVLTQVVVSPIPPSFTLSVTPSPITIGVGDTGPLLVTIKAVGGFSQPVALTCTGLPRESTCSFIQPTITGAGSTTLQLAVSAPHNCDSNTPYFVSSNIAGTPSKIALSVLFGGGLLLAGIRRRRKLLVGTIFALLLSIGGLSLVSGCGACTDLGTKPGVYSFTVVATAQGSTEVHSQTIPLTVTIP